MIRTGARVRMRHVSDSCETSVTAALDAATGAAADVPSLERALDANPRFRRDSAMGRIFHPGRVSFREISTRDSLHVIIDGARVSAHVDEISPLDCNPATARQYRWDRVVAHNLAGIAADLRRRVTGHAGRHRCKLECEVVWVDEDASA